jgi:hypothetical protein
MKKPGLFCLSLVGILLFAGPARADVVTDWNAIAVQTIGAITPASHARPGPSAILDFATVHAAMHDAIQAFEQRYESFAPPIPNATGSPIAAAATAAHDVLVARTLDQGPAFATMLNTRLFNYLNPLGLVGDPGGLVGQEAANRVLAIRGTIGTFPYPPEVFTGGTGPGEWRPTPPAFASMAAPWLRTVAPFTLKASDQLAGDPPPPRLGSGEYTHDYDETKALGRATGSSRTPEQTALALFYTDNFLTLWERTLRGVAAANTTNIGDSGRMFALANMAAADAIITAWTDKRGFNFWRPITAIQNGDTDGNPRTAGDPAWTPYLVTPPYPEYTSGANNLTGSMTRVLEHLFGDKTEFNVSSTPAGVTKTYQRFSDMADDVVFVRILQGIHFRSADEVARREGTRAADWAVSHVLRPIN